MPTIIINAISNHVSIAAIRNRSTVNCILLISTNSAIPTLKAIINAGMAATVKSNMPSPIKRRKMPRRLDPIAIRNATSRRRCCVRNQNVPITPKKIFSIRKNRMQKLCLHFVHIFKFADMTNIAERRCLQQKDVTYPI